MRLLAPWLRGWDAARLLTSAAEQPRSPFQAAPAHRAAGGEPAQGPVGRLPAYGLTGPKQHFLDAGFDDLVVKPYTLEDIEAMLQRWLVR